MGLWRFKIPNSMLLGLSYFLLNREMSDLGLHHIPKTLQRGNFFSESALRVTGKITESFKPFSSHKYPCVLDFHWSNETQPTKNLWWLLNTWMGITKHSTTCFIFLEKQSLDFGEGSTRLRSQHLLDVTSLSTSQPEAPRTPSSQGTPAALCVCSGRLFALQSIPTVRYYLRVGGGGTTPQTKPHKPHTYLWQLEDGEIKP